MPELLSSSLEESADKVRNEMVFKSQMTSFHIFCFYKLFITEICEKRKTRGAMLEEYQSNLCKLTNKEEDHFQQQIKHISKKVLSFDAYFDYVGLKPRSQPELTAKLKQAIKNSEQKGYHDPYEVQQWEEAITNERKKSQPKSENIAKLPSSE